MTFALSPAGEHAFRERSKKPPITMTRMKKCAGPCNRLHSVGQFAADDNLCAICRRRA